MRLRNPGKLAVQAAYWRAHGNPEAAERFEVALVAGSRCKRCGRTLIDPVSIAAGIGPECATREPRPSTPDPVPVISIGEDTSCGHWMPSGMRLLELGDGRRVCVVHLGRRC